MSVQDSHVLTARLFDLQRTVERLSHHVSDLQSQLANVQEPHRSSKFRWTFRWPRLVGRRVSITRPPVRENRRMLSHAHRSV